MTGWNFILGLIRLIAAACAGMMMAVLVGVGVGAMMGLVMYGVSGAVDLMIVAVVFVNLSASAPVAIGAIALTLHGYLRPPARPWVATILGGGRRSWRGQFRHWRYCNWVDRRAALRRHGRLGDGQG